MIFILAGTYNEAKEYAWRFQIKNFIYIHNANQLYGIKGGKIILVGTWYLNKEWDMIFDIARIKKIKIVEEKRIN